ncbi:MAG: hypothetical protein R3Y63_08835 [Eubacteriales bacterium]
MGEMIRALEKRGFLKQWGISNPEPKPQITKPTAKKYTVDSLLVAFIENGGSIPALAQLSEVSKSHLRLIAADQRTVSGDAQNRIMSAIFELEPSLALVEVEPVQRKVTRKELHKMYDQVKRGKDGIAHGTNY